MKNEHAHGKTLWTFFKTAGCAVLGHALASLSLATSAISGMPSHSNLVELHAAADQDRGHGGACGFDPLIPQILRHPASQLVLRGRPATFEVVAESAVSLSYQWQVNGTNLPNATNASLTLQVTQQTTPGLVSVLVSNAAGAVQSDPASLNVFSYFRTASNGLSFSFSGQPLVRCQLQASLALDTTNVWQTLREATMPININTAPADVLTRIPAIDDNIAQAIIQRRSGPDGIEGTSDDTPFRNSSEILWVTGIGNFSELHLLTTFNPPFVVIPSVSNPPGGGNPRTHLPTQFFRLVIHDPLPWHQ